MLSSTEHEKSFITFRLGFTAIVIQSMRNPAYKVCVADGREKNTPI